MIRCAGIPATSSRRCLRSRLRFSSSSSCGARGSLQHGRGVNVLRGVVIDSKALGIQLVLHADQIASVIYVVAGSVEVGASLDRALGHVQVVALLAKAYDLAIVIERVLLLVFALLVLGLPTENHYFLAGDLGRASVHDSKLVFVGDVVYGFPDISFDIKSFNFLNEIKR